MNFFDRALARLAPPATKAEPPGRLRALPDPQASYTIPDPASATNQMALYAKLAWIQIAVQRTSQTAATSAFSVLAGDKAIRNHPFVELLNRPNPSMSRFEFLEATCTWYKGAGNAYWWLNRPGPDTRPVELWLIPADRIQPVPDGQMGVRGYWYDTGSEKMPLDPWEIVHFKTFNPYTHYVGLSPILALAIDAHADIASQAFNANFYGKDNAKSAGILAFADAIDQPRWDRIKADWDEQHGGVKHNRVMRLRGVGAGGVQWIPTQLTRVETQYLEQREFTKFEMYDMFAPGLASVLAVNATEANSTAGKDTFLSMAVFPLQVALAEKISNDLLPIYGEGHAGVFDDVRRVDTMVELQQQEAYERSHTLDEVRLKYYGDPPIPDGDRPLAQGPAPQPPATHPLPAVEVPASDGAGDTGAGDDMAKWARKSMKRLADGKSAAAPFASATIPPLVAGDIDAALATARTTDEVRQAFKVGAPTDLTPNEAALYAQLVAVLERSGADTARKIARKQSVDLTALSAQIQAILLPAMTEMALSHAEQLAETIGPDFDPAEMDTGGWAVRYSGERAGQIVASTRTVIDRVIAQVASLPGLALAGILRLLAPAFGPKRAETIAVTEVTTAINRATIAYQNHLKDQGLEYERVWKTVSDERVCAVCDPLNGKPESAWSDQFPDGAPAHPRCRCETILRKRR